jgi:AcrR family transcriptional regulator
MVKATFTRLPKEKQKRIYDQLVLEFSRHPLAEAKVSHIVAGCGIARGSFYKYFDDLTDAYRYTLGQVLATVHSHVPEGGMTPQVAYELVADFVDKAQKSPWQGFIKMHFSYNDNAISAPKVDLSLEPEQWLIMLACHDVLRQVAQEPDKKDQLLALLKKSMEILEKGAK